MTPGQEALAREYAANAADVSTTCQLLGQALKALDAERERTAEAIRHGQMRTIGMRAHAVRCLSDVLGLLRVPERATIHATFVELVGGTPPPAPPEVPKLGGPCPRCGGALHQDMINNGGGMEPCGLCCVACHWTEVPRG
jgi:hypothetical protein